MRKSSRWSRRDGTSRRRTGWSVARVGAVVAVWPVVFQIVCMSFLCLPAPSPSMTTQRRCSVLQIDAPDEGAPPWRCLDFEMVALLGLLPDIDLLPSFLASAPLPGRSPTHPLSTHLFWASAYLSDPSPGVCSPERGNVRRWSSRAARLKVERSSSPRSGSRAREMKVSPTCHLISLQRSLEAASADPARSGWTIQYLLQALESRPGKVGLSDQELKQLLSDVKDGRVSATHPQRALTCFTCIHSAFKLKLTDACCVI